MPSAAKRFWLHIDRWRNAVPCGLFLLVFFLSLVVQVFSQNENEPIRVDTLLLRIPIIVTSQDGKSVPGLSKNDIRVVSNGLDVDIVSLSELENDLTLAILVDVSCSMASELGAVKKHANQLIDQLEPNDKVMIVAFRRKVEMLSNFTSDKRLLRQKIATLSTPSISNIDTCGTGVLYDAMSEILSGPFGKLSGRKVMVVFTDGGEQMVPRKTELEQQLADLDVIVFPIFYQSTPLAIGARKSVSFAQFVELPHIEPLYEFALLTGGRLLIDRQQNFEAGLKSAVSGVRRTYVLDIYPNEGVKGQAGNIQIISRDKSLTITARRTIRVEKIRIR